MSPDIVRIQTSRELLEVTSVIDTESLVVDSVGTARCLLHIDHGTVAMAVIGRRAWMSPDVPKRLRRVFSALEKISQLQGGRIDADTELKGG